MGINLSTLNQKKLPQKINSEGVFVFSKLFKSLILNQFDSIKILSF
jgi:hypothetical protein